jgi:nucleotide sugar dehydrogenase
MKIAVVGMGKIGLPLAVQYAKKGNTVTGIDINPKTIELINQGIEPFPEEDQLKEYLVDVVGKGLLSATLDYEKGIKGADVIVVVVPLFVNNNGEPEFSAIDQATVLIGSNLKKGSLICYETTVPIGTTRNRFLPSLEEQSGLKVGIDFNVVFSPERVFTGRIFEDLKKYPKIVGGITKSCTEKGVSFYSKVLDFDKRDYLTKSNGVWEVESTESAEFVKLAETTYRDVNIALANQFAMYADKIGVDIYEIIESANSQDFSRIHQPGISVGGHCIPVYPQFYLSNDPSAEIVSIARALNDQMPIYSVNYIRSKITIEKESLLIYGITYRRGVKETHLSGVFSLIKDLEKYTDQIYVDDPLYNEAEIKALNLKFCADKSKITCIVLHTDHKEFNEINFQEFKNLKYIFYGRAVTPIDGFSFKILGGKKGII